MSVQQEYEQVAARGVELFLGKLNCAESTLLALCEYYQIEAPFIPAIATPFGAGVCQLQSVCGALSGALMVVGMHKGRSRADQSNIPAQAMGQRILREFSGVDGKTSCMDWIEHDVKDLEVHQQFLSRKGRETICAELVRRACMITLEALEPPEGEMR